MFPFWFTDKSLQPEWSRRLLRLVLVVAATSLEVVSMVLTEWLSAATSLTGLVLLKRKAL